ncbi:MAG: DUF4199 domain-containing protein [Pricia sp.]
MKTTVFPYGIYAFTCAALLFIVILYVGQGLGFEVQEILGYLTIVVSLLFVYFGIKHFRDVENQGIISLGKAIVIGILITVFASAGFTIADTIYVTLINPDFAQQYFEYSLEKMETELSPEEFKIQKAVLTEQIEKYANPAFNAAVMFLTVIVIGCIVSLISALVLHRKTGSST